VPAMTDISVKNADLGEHTDDAVGGLLLVVRPSTRKSAGVGKKSVLRRAWVLRVSHDGQRRRIGLGPYPLVGLAAARQKAAETKRMLAMGQDPTRAGRARQRAAAEASVLTFGLAVDLYLAEAAPSFKNAKSEAGRLRALKRICAPLNDRRVESIGVREVAAILKTLRPGTADRTRSALNGVFAFATIVMEQHGVLMRNPASSDLLKAAGYSKNVSRGRQPALPYSALPAFLSELAGILTPAARCLEFIISTVARSGPARLAKFSDIDLEARIWRVPRGDLKDSRHRSGVFAVPLNPLAVSAVEAMQEINSRRAKPSRFVFSEDNGEVINDMKLITLSRRMRRTGKWLDPDAERPFVVHGFRATFRTWAQEQGKDRELAELSMGHKFYGAAEGRYPRGDLLEPRRKLLDEWSSCCVGAEIVPLRRA
jgi:integrase